MYASCKKTVRSKTETIHYKGALNKLSHACKFFVDNKRYCTEVLPK